MSQDRFLMIRDGDGQDPEKLKRQLCKYYEDRNQEETVDVLPRNVLILKYYSFENYFLNPVIMTELGIVKSEQGFYQILFQKWKEYLRKIKIVQKYGLPQEKAEEMVGECWK